MLTVLVAFAPTAAACPTCAVGAGIETLAYIVGFLGIPYLIVMGTLFWMRRLLKSEQESIAEAG
ncbi:MAG: hypothetical protein ACI8TQ_003343 [Planctomycetota bacterium]|jgi:hypothetical protein